MPAVAPGGVGRLLVKLIVTLPGGTVITTGDQPIPAFAFNGAQLAGLESATVALARAVGTVVELMLTIGAEV